MYFINVQDEISIFYWYIYSNVCYTLKKGAAKNKAAKFSDLFKNLYLF